MAIKSQRKRAKPQKRKKTKVNIELDPQISREAYAISYLTLGILMLLVLFGAAGPLGLKIDLLLSSLFGVGRYVMPLLFLALALALFYSRKIEFTITRNLGILFLVMSFLGLIHLGTPLNQMNVQVENYGGWIGFCASVIFRIFFSTPDSDLASFVILFGIFLSSLIISLEISFRDIWDYFYPEAELSTIKSKKTDRQNPEISEGEIKIIKPAQAEIETSEDKKLLEASPAIEIKKPEPIKLKRPKKDDIKMTNIQVSGDWKFPSLDLLVNEVSKDYPKDEELHSQAQNIKEKLGEFGISVEMVDARVGPTVTQFTASPQEGVSVKKISNAKEDLALALAAKSVRIEAPIPGQPYVGIEIPNQKRSTVFMREILDSEKFSDINSKLRLAVGKDVAGNPVVTDLAKMPHLLIAGATGSGKSVGMNAFLISLLYQNSPSDLKFIMVDPKRVELKGYNGIPHLLTPVITEAEKALAALKWSVGEMMRRYEDLSEKGYRNISEYNEGEEEKLPNIVIVIDELADLMMRDLKKDTEAAICRLAQMARAVGMHLIIATQRPSVDVITGVIKANIPTRISFTVTSSVDSRTILDSVGAEDLLGQGDMLFVDANTPKPQRIQGIYLSSKEIEKVIRHIKLTPEGQESTQIDLSKREGEAANDIGIGIDLEAIAEAANEDELVPDAIDVIKNTGKASATLFQRTLSVGYARAAKILDILEKKGIVGPANGAKPREIYLDKD